MGRKSRAGRSGEATVRKKEVQHANLLPVLWSRFPRLDREIVQSVWEQTDSIDEAATVLRQLQPAPTEPIERGVSELMLCATSDVPTITQPTACWGCPACTFDNSADARACEMCGTMCSKEGAPSAPAGGPAAAAAAPEATTRAYTGLDASSLRTIPPDALGIVLGLLAYDDTQRLSGACRELRDIVRTTALRAVRLNRRHAHWSDARVLGLLRSARELEAITIDAAVHFTSFGALPALRRAPQLHFLSICSPFFSDEQLVGWGHAFTALEELRLARCELSDACVPALSALPALTRLDLSANRRLSTRGVAAILVGCARLRAIDASRLPGVDVGVCAAPVTSVLRSVTLKAFTAQAPVFNRWAHLESLQLQQSALVSAVVQLPSLRQLSLASCKALTQLTLACRQLTALDLASCAALAQLRASDCGRLERLNMAMCRRVDAHAVTSVLAQACGTLAHANLNGLTRVREEPLWLTSAPAIVERVGPQLVFLDLRGSCTVPSPHLAQMTMAARDDRAA